MFCSDFKEYLRVTGQALAQRCSANAVASSQVGVGTFLNLPHYPTTGDQVTSLTGIDLSKSMLSVAEETLASFDQTATSVPLQSVRLIPMDAESLTFPDGTSTSILSAASI